LRKENIRVAVWLGIICCLVVLIVSCGWGANCVPGYIESSGANCVPGYIESWGANCVPGYIESSGANCAPVIVIQNATTPLMSHSFLFIYKKACFQGMNVLNILILYNLKKKWYKVIV